MITRRLMNNDKIVRKQINEPTILNECKGSYFNGIDAYGKSTQINTTGAQLLRPEMNKEVSNFGINVTINNGIASFKGIRNEENLEIRPNLAISIKQEIKENKTIYAKSDNTDIIVDLHIVTSSGESLYGQQKYIVVGDEKEINFRVLYGEKPVPSGTKIDATAKVMVTYDESAEWEPYTGGKPSPSPEYPQPINNVGGSNNLIPILEENLRSDDGLKGVINQDGSITVTGTPTKQYSQAMLKKMDLPNGEYYISGGSIQPKHVVFQINILHTDGRRSHWKNSSFTVDSTVKKMETCIQYESSDLQPVNYTIYPMLNKGEKPLPFETYVDSINVDVNGGNLLDLSQGKSGTGEGVTYTKNPDGSYRRTGTATGTAGNVWFLGGYALDPNTPENVLFTLKPGTYTFIDGVILSNKEARRNTFTIDSDFKVTGVRNPSQELEKTYNDTIYPMLNVGSTPLPFEPYKPKQTLSLKTPNGLPGIPLSDENTDMDITPTYVDKDGKRWVCDEIDLGRGKYVQRVKEINPADYDNLILDNATDPIRFNLFKIPDTINERKRFEILSNRFVFGSNNVHKVGISFTYGDKIYFYLPSTVTTVEQAKQWFIDNLTTLMYMLGEPIERDLTPEEIASYKSVHTYATNTTITSEPNVSMNVIYRKLRN